jgi:SulP family sulfate permease
MNVVTPTRLCGSTGPMTVIYAPVIVAFPRNISAVFTSVFFAGVLQILFVFF